MLPSLIAVLLAALTFDRCRVLLRTRAPAAARPRARRRFNAADRSVDR